jgi:hypothetical protein
MQAGDRLGYHPENAADVIAHFHEVLPKAQAAVTEIDATFAAHVVERINLYSPERWIPGALNVEAIKKRCMEAMGKAKKLMDDTGK